MPDFLDFRKFRGGNDSKTTSSGSNPTKKDQNAALATPLERMLENAGPIRQDGSDKFFGMENFGNTCYCNSILQCLYYTPAFRDNVLSYPERSTIDALTAAAATAAPRQPYRLQNGVLVRPGQPQPQPKVITPASQPGQKPEDKDSPEYKKKLALVAGPIVNLAYQNNTSYDMPETMFTSLKDLFEAVVVNQNRHGVVSPTRFLEVLKRDNEMFRSAMHQDAHEFLNLLLNTVLESIEAHEKYLDENTVDKTIEHHIAAPKPENPTVSWPNILPQSEKKSHTKWLRDMFEGTLTSETRCLTCETTSHRDEPFLDLSVDLEQHSSITSCLNHFSQEEMLCERNKFHCDNCGGLQEAEKRMKIKKLPQILALHLKRFKYTEDLARLQKLFHKVVYPYHLRLFNTTDEAEDPDRLYELYGVVVHIGGGPYHGHYVSIIKTEDRGWLLFDDEMVEPVDRAYVRNFFGDKSGLACAYVLFYRATTEEQVYREAMIPGKGGAPQDLSHEQSIRAEEAAEMHRVYSATTPLSPLETSHFLNLDHAVTAPQFSPNGHIEIPQSPNVLLSPGGTTTQTKKEKAKEEKERKAAEKAAEKEREKIEKQRKKELEQKPRKSEEDRRNGAVEDDREGQTNGISGLDIFRRSKSIRFGSLGRKEKSSWSSASAIDDSAGQSTAPSFAASSQTTVDDHPSQESVGNVTIEKDKEKEKKNRFSFRKKSDVMR